MSEQQELLSDAEIARRGSRGALTFVLRTGTTQVVQAVSALAVARVLEPRVYGVFALALTLVGAVRVFGDLGITYSLGVERKIADADLETGCAVALVIALLGGGIISVIWLALPLVHAAGHGAAFVAPAMLLTLLIAVPAFPSTTVLDRRLAFSTLGVISVVQTIVLFGLQVALLLEGLGIWAMVIAQVAGASVGTLLTVRASGRLYLPRIRGPLTKLIRDGLPFQAAVVATSAVGTLTPTLVAVLLGARGVGLFAWCTILATPVAGVLTAVHSVSSPALARMRRDDGQRYSESAAVVTQTLAATAAVGAGCLIGLAHPIIRYVFGSRWLPATGGVQFCLAGTIPLAIFTALISDANARLNRRLSLIAAVVAGAAALAALVPLTLLGGVGGAAAAAYVVGPAIGAGTLAAGLRVPITSVVLRAARIFGPLVAISFGLARIAHSPLSFAGACAVMGLIGIFAAYVLERALAGRLWRQVRPAR